MMLVFGTCTILVVTVFNFSGLFAIRWFLGMAESAFFPLVIYYQTTLVFLNFVHRVRDFLTYANLVSIVVENWPADSPSFTQHKALPLHSRVYSLSVSSVLRPVL
jgi:hypothetical protein